MTQFFGKDVLLGGRQAKRLYAAVATAPIYDYHCHLDPRAIASDAPLTDIGALWLGGDHYKWRAMRMCGMDESYITGERSYREKFIAFASICPRLAGNPLYHWAHLELKTIFGVDAPLCAQSAAAIYDAANAHIAGKRILDLLRQFDVRYIATTDDPLDDLSCHGRYGDTLVAPTFRADRAFACEADYLVRLGEATGRNTATPQGLLDALTDRLDYFVAHGCKLTDFGADDLAAPIDDAEAQRRFAPGNSDPALAGWLLSRMAERYAERGLIMQLHLGTRRNQNTAMLSAVGRDSGFDVMGSGVTAAHVARLIDALSGKGRLPRTILYTLNPHSTAELATLTGAFRGVVMGAAWWFNDTAAGIRRHLSETAEYAALGTSPGMLTDSRSFTSYPRFDYFRRLLCSYLGEMVDSGTLAAPAALETAQNVCYKNIKEWLTV